MKFGWRRARDMHFLACHLALFHVPCQVSFNFQLFVHLMTHLVSPKVPTAQDDELKLSTQTCQTLLSRLSPSLTWSQPRAQLPKPRQMALELDQSQVVLGSYKPTPRVSQTRTSTRRTSSCLRANLPLVALKLK